VIAGLWGRLPSMTLVTAALDLGRSDIDGWARRPFEFYTSSLRRLLRRYRDVPVIVHIAPEHESLVWSARTPENTLVVPTTGETLRSLAFYDRVQAIRTSDRWVAAATWLQKSPQRLLPGYLPLVLAKPGWLRDAAAANPFDTARFVWMDGGLPANPVYASLSRRRFIRGIDFDGFRVLSVPYTTNDEIHGFDRRACARYCDTDFVSWHIRGGVFGGTPDAVATVADLYDSLLDDTLTQGHLGTEETLLTILAHRHPTLLRRRMLPDS
jgi:hypothetical protein